MQILTTGTYRRMVGLAAIAAALASMSPAATAQSGARTVALDAGTVIPVRLNDNLNSKDAQKGDTFTATVKSDSGDGNADFNVLPPGTKIEGVVRSARPKQDKNPGVLDLEFRHVRLPDGRSISIDGSLIGLDSKSVSRDRDGRLIAKPGHKTDRLTYVGYGAGAGLLIGALTKKPIEGTVLGAGLGYLFGALEKNNNNPKDVVLKPGQEMGVRLDRRLSYARSDDDYRDNRDGSDTSFHRNPRNDDRPDRNLDNPGGIGVLFNDNNVRFNSTAQPFEARGVVMVPAEPVMRAAGIDYHYDRAKRQIRASSDQGIVRLSVGSRIAVVNGNRRVRLEAPAQWLNGTVYVPRKFVDLVTGTRTNWDAGSRTVIIGGDTDRDAR